MNQVAARISPATVAQACDPDYQAPPHLRLLSSTIMREVAKGSARIIVTMPPRHGKSEMCSKWTPVWFLENWPQKRVLLASYGASFADEWGRKVRNAFQQHSDFLKTMIVGDSRAANRWNTTKGGGMATCGVGGTITGKGADILIIDDPVKNSEEARSEVYREKHWVWWQETSRSRLEPGGSVIVIMTRWNADDLVGRLNASDPDGDIWTRIDFPAVAEDDDDLGRERGEPLWPKRYDTEALAEIKRDVGSYGWNALYQQRPTPEGGGMFRRKDFRYFREEADHYVLRDGDNERRILKNHVSIIQTCDTAMKDGVENDWTVVTTVAVTGSHDIIVLDVRRERLEVPDQWPFVRDTILNWSYLAEYRWAGCEDKGSGIGLLQVAKRAGMPMRELKAVTSKVTRATPASIHYENQLVYHREGASWLADLEDELLTFPNGKHDDQVDCIAYAVAEATRLPDSRLASEPSGVTEQAPTRDHEVLRRGMAVAAPGQHRMDDLDEDDIEAGF